MHRDWRIKGGIAPLVALACTVQAGAARAQAAPDPDDELLFDLRLGKASIGQGIRGYSTKMGVCLDLQDTLDALQVAITIDRAHNRATGWAFQESRTIDIDRQRRVARFGGQYADIAPATIVDTKQGWCVVADELGRWLGVSFDPDITNAVLKVSSTTALPIEAALKRAAAAERLLARRPGLDPTLPRVSLPYRFWRSPSVDATVSIAGDLSAKKPKVQASYEAFAAGELGYFSAEARMVSDRRAVPQSARLRLYRADPEAGLLGKVRATQVALGDVVSQSSPLVAQASVGRGASITNQPLTRANAFEKVNLSGSLPGGWDVELYRNGELIRAYSGGGNGRYEFHDVELRYGRNVFEIVRYGPQGQVRRETKTYLIGREAIAPGRTQWWANAVDQGRDLIDFRDSGALGTERGLRLGAGVEHGIGHSASVGLSMHHMGMAKGRGTFVEATGRISLGPTEVEVGHALSFASAGSATRVAAVGEVLGTSFSLETVRNRGLQTDRLQAAVREDTRVAVDRAVRLGGMVMPLHFDLRALKTTSLRSIEVRSRIAVTTRRIALSAITGVRRTRPLVGPPVTEGELGLLANTRIGRLRLRGESYWDVGDRRGFRTAQLTANFQAGASSAVQMSGAYDRLDDSGRFGLSFSRDFRRFALASTAEVTTRGRMALGLNLLMSVGHDGFGRFGHVSSLPQASEGTLAVNVYRDLDGNGRRDADEPLVDRANLTINDIPLDRPTASPRDGHRTQPDVVGDLAPTVPIKVAIDPASIPDPYDMPATAGVVVVPRAGIVTPIDLGIVATGAIEGSVVVAGRPLAGERIDLIDAKGQVRMSAHSEFDGFFVFERVPYGRYTLRAASTGAAAISTTLVVDRANPSVRLQPIDPAVAAAPRPAPAVAAVSVR